jgi:hypothetical protein
MECHQSGLAPVSAIPVLKYLEKVVHPRWPIAFEAAKCAAVWGNCRRGPYQRLGVIGQPLVQPFEILLHHDVVGDNPRRVDAL